MAAKKLGNMVLSPVVRLPGKDSTSVNTAIQYMQTGSGDLQDGATVTYLTVDTFKQVDFVAVSGTDVKSKTALFTGGTGYIIDYTQIESTCRGGSLSTVELSSSGLGLAVSADDEFIGFKIKLTDGDGNEYIREITDSTASSNTVTLDEAVDSAIDSNWRYELFAVKMTHANPSGSTASIKFQTFGKYGG